MYIGLHVKYRSFLSDINVILIYLDRISKNSQKLNFKKICVGGSRVVPCGRTDVT